jgi:hypothetical protein
MLVDLIALVLAIVAVGLVPVVMMAALFGLVDHFSDEEKLDEVRRANREGRPVDFSGVGVTHDQQTLSTDASTDDMDRPLCPSCGEENSGEFDRCWNCQTTL